MTGPPCTAFWWSARLLSVLNRFEQSVHWKGFIAETTTNSLPGNEASQVKAKLNFPGSFYVSFFIHAQIWPLKGKSPTSSYTSRLVPSRYLIVFWDERRLGIRLRRAGGVMGREEGKIATAIFPSSLPMRPRSPQPNPQSSLIPKTLK